MDSRATENDISMASVSHVAGLSTMSLDDDAKHGSGSSDGRDSSDSDSDSDDDGGGGGGIAGPDSSKLDSLIAETSSPLSFSRPGTFRGASPPIARPLSPVPQDTRPRVSKQLRTFESLAESAVDKDLLTARPEVVVVLCDAGFKHKMSRSWISKKSLATVVERPERLKACSLGIGLAKTHVPLRVVESTRRTSLYAPHFAAVHGKDWATELYALCSQAASKLSKGELEVPESWPYYDIYLAPETVEALEGNVAAVEKGVDEIFTGDAHRAFVAVRPPGHHCHEDEASGFCLINNAHIAIQYARAHHGITHAIILDFDLHHGDGNQDLLWKLGFKPDGKADVAMGYFSLHDINSFPCELGVAQPRQIADASVCFIAHNCAVWNVHLKPYADLEEFDRLYEKDYSVLFERAAEFLDTAKTQAAKQRTPFKPLVVVSAGFDGSELETPGMQRHEVHLPTSFFNRFTRDCVALAENYGDGHLLSVLEGGYSSAAIATGVFSHLTGLSGVPYNKEWCPTSTITHEVDLGMRQRWKLHPEQWSAQGIQLGRSLFPTNEPPEPAANARAADTKPPISGRHHLRRNTPRFEDAALR